MQDDPPSPSAADPDRRRVDGDRRPDLSQLREGDQHHLGADIIELSRPVAESINGQLVVYAWRGPLIGQIDRRVEHRIDPQLIEERVSPHSIRRRLRSGPHYEAGLRVGREDVIDFLRDHLKRFGTPEQLVAVEQAVDVYRRRHRS